MTENVYEEQQEFPKWVYWLMWYGAAVQLVALAIILMRSSHGLGAIWVPCVATAVILMATLILGLKTTVTVEGVRVRLGRRVHIVNKFFRAADITAVRAVTYRPIMDAGGWGYRFGRFEGARCRFLNARGNQGVLIETPSQRFIIGSQQPQELLRAIEGILPR